MKALEKLYLPPELLTEEGVMAMKLMELKATLRSLMLPVIGTRDVLRKRLINQARREAERGGKNWDQKKVMEWLQNAAEKYGLKATTLVIISLQDLDGPGFLSLTCSEIKEIGVTPLGQVKNVERAVEALKEKLSF
uniref:SAM domain-containing protein n=1 Tax=Amorphochlora amoebiformis TaxID=1561963 RepID=A0A7S0H5C4_9EUKA